MSAKSFTFTHAVVRAPSRSSAAGLRAVDIGSPDLDLFCAHHQQYVAALESTGATVLGLPANEAFPDSVFVEDAALCLQELAIIMRPGAPTRLGEAQLIEPALSELYSTVLRIEGPGYIEGGDILTTEKEILVGISARTDQAGVEELQGLVADFGYTVRIVHTPDDILHFKTDCSLLDEQTILATPQLAATGCFEGYNVIYTVEGENACANTVRFNNLVLVPDGYPETARLLEGHGYEVRTVANSEAAKIDGGMSCLSLRFTPS